MSLFFGLAVGLVVGGFFIGCGIEGAGKAIRLGLEEAAARIARRLPLDREVKQ